MTLLNVETNLKHGCLSKLAKSKIRMLYAKVTYSNHLMIGYPSLCGFDLWTSGSNFGTDEYAWAAGKKLFQRNTINWKSDQPKTADGDCVSINFSNKTANESTFSLGKCAEEKYFTCEVLISVFVYCKENLIIKFRRPEVDQKLTTFKKNACQFMTYFLVR